MAVHKQFNPDALSIEHPDNPLTDLDVRMYSTSTQAGVNVDSHVAVTHPAVNQAVQMISTDVASLQLNLFRQEGDYDSVRDFDNPVADVVAWQPNDSMNAYNFWRRMVAWKLLYGNAFAWIRRAADGSAVELFPLLPDRTSLIDDGTAFSSVHTYTQDGRDFYFSPNDVLHLQGISYDNMAGAEWIEQAKLSIGLGLAELGFASKFYASGGRTGGILQVPPGTPQKARRNMEEGFKRSYGDNEAFKTVVLREGAVFHKAQMTPSEAQGVQARGESVRDIARLFNIRPGKLGEESRSSYASKSEDNRDYLDTTLKPHLVEIEHECRAKLLSVGMKSSRYFFQYDTSTLLRMDMKSLSESIATLRGAEVINSNEARSLLGLNRREDAGGELYSAPGTEQPPAETSQEQELEQESDDSNDDGTSPVAKACAGFAASRVTALAGIFASKYKTKSRDDKALAELINKGTDQFAELVIEVLSEVAGLAGATVNDNEAMDYATHVASEAKSLAAISGRDNALAAFDKWKESFKPVELLRVYNV